MAQAGAAVADALGRRDGRARDERARSVPWLPEAGVLTPFRLQAACGSVRIQIADDDLALVDAYAASADGNGFIGRDGSCKRRLRRLQQG